MRPRKKTKAPVTAMPLPASPLPAKDLRYPIGRFTAPASISLTDRRHAILTLAQTPELLREALRPLDHDQRNTPYRDGGWTVRQVVHHLADSHMTAFHRMRRALTEDWPQVAPYDEAAFALLPDVAAPVEWSLELIESLHARWVLMLQGLTEDQFHRGFLHPVGGRVTLDAAICEYAWHSRHHLAHILHLRQRQGW